MLVLKHILVATDFGDAAANALAYGREFARRYDATLHVVHVVDDVGARLLASAGLPYDVAPLQADLDQLERRRLEDLLTEEDQRELRIRLLQRVSTSPARAIVEYAADAKIDLIILGTHGRGAISHLVMGSVAERVVRTAPCPVLTVRQKEHEFLQPDALETVRSV